LSHLAGVVIEQIALVDGAAQIVARARGSTACGRCSAEPSSTCYATESSTQPHQHSDSPITESVPEPIPVAANKLRRDHSC
jgi:hypothetical protein